MPPGLTSPMHLGIIILVALVVLGPERMPQAMRTVGRTMADVRRWYEAVTDEVRDVISLDGGDDAPVAPAAPPPAPSGAAPAVQAEEQQPPPPATPPTPTPAHPRHPALQEGGEWY